MALGQEAHGVVEHPRRLDHVDHHLLEATQRGVLIHHVIGEVRHSPLLDLEDVPEEILDDLGSSFGFELVVLELGEAKLVEIRRAEDHGVEGPGTPLGAAVLLPGLETPATASDRHVGDPLPHDQRVVAELVVVVEALAELELEETRTAILAAQAREGNQLHPAAFGEDQQHGADVLQAVVLLPELAPLRLDRQLCDLGDAAGEISQYLTIRIREHVHLRRIRCARNRLRLIASITGCAQPVRKRRFLPAPLL